MKRSPLKRTRFKVQQSAKLRRFNSDFKMIRPQVLSRGCEFREAMRMHPEVARVVEFPMTCSGYLQAHHVIPRSDPRSNNTPQNLACLCNRHHDWVHNGHPAAARQIGLLD